MTTFKHFLTGLALGGAVFLSAAAMLTLSSGAAIFKYQGF